LRAHSFGVNTSKSAPCLLSGAIHSSSKLTQSHIHPFSCSRRGNSADNPDNSIPAHSPDSRLLSHAGVAYTIINNNLYS
jgi:hypothetical protein